MGELVGLSGFREDKAERDAPLDRLALNDSPANGTSASMAAHSIDRSSPVKRLPKCHEPTYPSGMRRSWSNRHRSLLSRNSPCLFIVCLIRLDVSLRGLV
jgi:hypothetical protein